MHQIRFRLGLPRPHRGPASKGRGGTEMRKGEGEGNRGKGEEERKMGRGEGKIVRRNDATESKLCH